MKKEQEQEQIREGYTRVTEVLSPFSDFSHIEPAVLANAADRGSRVHDYCEAHAKHLFVFDVDKDCKPYFESFKRWFDETVEEVAVVEERFYSDTYRITGKVDLICRLKGDECFSIVDYKTPASVSLTWDLQSAAYRLLTADRVPTERRLILMLPKDGSDAKVIEFTNHEQAQELYLNALKLYRYFKG